MMTAAKNILNNNSIIDYLRAVVYSLYNSTVPVWWSFGSRLQVTVSMEVGDASLNMKIFYKHIVTLAESGGTMQRQSGDVQSYLKRNIKMNHLCKNTKVYSCTLVYRFITCRMACDSTSTLQAHILPACLIVTFPSYLISKVMSPWFRRSPQSRKIFTRELTELRTQSLDPQSNFTQYSHLPIIYENLI